MRYRLDITRTAEKDIESAADYIEFILKNTEASEQMLNEVTKQISRLQEYPEKYEIVNDPILRIWKIRCVAIKRYLVFYTVCSETITILRVLNSRRDWMGILRRELGYLEPNDEKTNE